jgi:hypothetical protein
VSDMDSLRAGGAALVTTPDTSESAADEFPNHLRVELEAARRRSIMTNARLAVLLRDDAAPMCELAKAADEASLAAGRVSGFARMLCKSIPVFLLSVI